MRRPSFLPRRLRQHADRGTSLVETLVVVAMLSVVAGATADTMISGLQSTNGSDVRTAQTQQLRQALDRMTKLLRSAVNLPDTPYPRAGFLTSGADEVIFYANFDNAVASPSPGAASVTNGPFRVQYLLDPTTGNLVENIWQPTPSGSTYAYPPVWSTPWSSHVLATDMQVPAPQPLFTYLSADDTTTSSLTTGDSVELALGEPKADGGACTGPCVAAVAVSLTAAGGGHGVPPATAETQVALPNAAAEQLPVVIGSPPATSSPTPPPTTTPPPATTPPTTAPPTTKPPTTKPPTTKPPTPTPTASKSTTKPPTTKPPTTKPPTTKPPTPTQPPPPV